MADFAGKTRVVFVGNLPYDATEQEVQKVFEVAGPVVSFRHVFDRDSNKAKGFGFCEYYDVDTAASAVRNLNGVAEVRGRLLRVDFAQPDIKDLPKDQRGARDKNGLPPLPPGVILPPGVPPAESIHKTLQNMPPAQLLDVMHQMKGLVVTSPEQARALLNLNPQLCYALFQAMLMMNIVDHSVLQRMIVPGSSGSHLTVVPLQANPTGPSAPFLQQPQNPYGAAPPSSSAYAIPPGGPPQAPTPQYGAGGPPVAPPSLAGGQPGFTQQQAGMPPSQIPYGRPPQAGGYPGGPPQQQQHQGYGQPQAPAPPQQQQQQALYPQQPGGYGTPPPGAQPNAQQQALLQQVLAMTPQQIALLPEEQRATVMQIRQSAGRA